MYRAAVRRHPEVQEHLEASTAAVIGTVAHRVLNQVSRGRIEVTDDIDGLPLAEKKALVAGIWEEELARVLEEWGDDLPEGGPSSWSGFGMKRARTIRKATEELEAWGPEARRESPESPAGGALQDGTGKLRGIPDRISSTPDGLVIDEFKTGKIRDTDGTVREEYRRQVLIYAWLVRENLGEFPTQVRIVPIAGEPHVEAPSLEESRRAAQDALRDLDRYNKALASAGPDPQDQQAVLAQPSPDTCRWCQARAWCEAYWESGVPAENATDTRRDVRGRVTEAWEAPEPMELRGPGGTTLRLSVGPELLPDDGGRLEGGPLVRCLGARVGDESGLYYADANSELWWGPG